jgi:hypothetical protein
MKIRHFSECPFRDRHAAVIGALELRIGILSEEEILRLGDAHRRLIGMDDTTTLRSTVEHAAGETVGCLWWCESVASGAFLRREDELGIDYHATPQGERADLLENAYEAVQRAGTAAGCDGHVPAGGLAPLTGPWTSAIAAPDDPGHGDSLGDPQDLR